MTDPIMVGGEENLWNVDVLKSSISELILSDKTWKGMKTVFFRIWVTAYIQNFRILAWRLQHLVALYAMKICLNYPLDSFTPQPFAKAEFLLQVSKYQSFALIKENPTF